MRELSMPEIRLVAGGNGVDGTSVEDTLRLGTVTVTGQQTSSTNWSAFANGTHGFPPITSVQWTDDGDGGGGGDTEDEGPLVFDPIIIRPGDNTSEDDDSIYCSDGGAWQEQDQYGNIWKICLNDDGTTSYEFIRQIYVS